MWSKLLAMVTLNWTAMSWGFTHGYTAGMVGALQKHDEGIVLSEGQIFLIAAFLTFSSTFGLLYLPLLGDKVGRRWCVIICSMPLVISWIILYYAKTFAAFMWARFVCGLGCGPLFVLYIIVTAEYTSYKSRGFHLSVVVMLTPTFGIALGHVLGVLFHWRTLTFVGVVLSTVHMVLPYFWVESPHWLASKGRFEECERSFRKLNGTDASAEHELQLLIKIEINKQKAASEMNTNHILQKLLWAFKRRYFWELILMSFVIYTYYTAAGKVVFSNLATVVLEEVTGTSDVLLFTCVVDGFIFLGTCISCFLIRKIPIRVLLFSSGLAANAILLTLSACLYYKNGETYFQWIIVILLALYFIVTHAGPYPVMDILLGEMFPLELKLYCFLLASPILIGTVFLSLLILPYLVGWMGYHGLFLLNVVIMCICLAFFYVRMPETKGKTLHEIEVYFKTNNFDVDEVLSTEEHVKSLI